MDKIRTSVPSLPEGWVKEVVIRKSGASAGKSDVYYYSPEGKKCRSKPQMLQYLPEDFEIENFDFRGGASTEALLRRRRKRKDDFNFGKDFSLSGSDKPTRQTKKARENMKISVIHSTDVDSRKGDDLSWRRKRAGEESKRRRAENLTQRFSKPKQLFWQSRLQNLKPKNDKTFKSCPASRIESVMKNLLPGSNEQGLLNSLWYSLFNTTNKVVGQQHASLNALRKHPTALCSINQPFAAPFTVTEEMIREQERRVKTARQKLCEAQELLSALEEEEMEYDDFED